MTSAFQKKRIPLKLACTLNYESHTYIIKKDVLLLSVNAHDLK